MALELVIEYTDREERVPCSETVIGNELAYTRTRKGNIKFTRSGVVNAVRVERNGILSAFADFVFPINVFNGDNLEVTWTLTFEDRRSQGGGISVQT